LQASAGNANLHHHKGGAMTRDDFLKILARERLNPHFVAFDDPTANECMVIVSGLLAPGIWSVFYSEREVQTYRRDFATESDALHYLLSELRKTESARLD
jgi:hypothetical protein